MTGTSDVAPWQFDQYVHAEAEGYATPEQAALLEANAAEWQTTLLRLRRETREHLQSARKLPGDERDLVVADLEEELEHLDDAWDREFGEPEPEPVAAAERRVAAAPKAPGRVQLQLSWEPGSVVAWAGGHGVRPGNEARVRELLSATGAPESNWRQHAAISLTGNARADAVAIPVGEILGWLVAAGAGELSDDLAPSARWLGGVAIWAVELTSRGAMVPLLRRRTRRSGRGDDAVGSYSVRWTPALVAPDRLARTAQTMPGSVRAADRKIERAALTRSVLTGVVDAICRQSARRVDAAAAPPRVRTANDVAEAFLAHLDGSAFDAPVAVATPIVTRIEQWARAVTGSHEPLVVRLDPPEGENAWHLEVFATQRGSLVPIEQAIVMPGSERQHLELDLARLERMVPALTRPGGIRRGQVILSADEAWTLMAETGPRLAVAGYDVRVPELSPRRSRPSLRVFVENAETAVGVNQLANVRWTALFDDVELTADNIKRLAAEARPLIRSGGQWIAIDHADLEAAADALAERSRTEQLSGGEMLRLALGLEESTLEGGVSIAGGGWASDLLTAASQIGTKTAVAPAGFVGELRTYQTEALEWLQFLDTAGLGGCLALDMGLGKTPTLLAQLLAGAGDGPALVVAPAAVVGNWAAEAARFTPELRVLVHHGPDRASEDEIADEVADADVVVTTYATAVRDVDAIAEVTWARVVLDEAQAIKNPANETSQQLRRIPARSRIALTGTPIENGLGDLWAILDFTNPGLVGPRPQFIAALSAGERATRAEAEDALRALNGILLFRRTKAEPEIAAELPDKIDELDHCAMTPEQIGLYQALLDRLVTGAAASEGGEPGKGQVLAAITGLKQICNHPWAYQNDDKPLTGRSGKLARLEEIVEAVFAAGEKMLVFTHFAEWGVRLAEHLTETTGTPVECYHGGLTRTVRDRIVEEFQAREGPGVLVLSLKAGGTGLNLTAASHVVLYDRWWNPAVEDQARDRAWRIGQNRTVISHRLICPGTVDERVEEVVAGKRRIADLVLPKSSSLDDLDSEQLRSALGIRPDTLLTTDGGDAT